MAENDDELNEAIKHSRTNDISPAHNTDPAHITSPAYNMHPAYDIDPAYILSIDVDKIEEILKMWWLLSDETQQKIAKKIIQLVGGCTHHPPAKKILMNFVNVLQNQNDCKVIYAIKKIGYIWFGKLVELGMSKDTIKRSFNRLEKMGFINSADLEDIQDTKIIYIFPSINHIKQANIKILTDYAKILFHEHNLEVDSSFKNKVDKFAEELKNIQPQDIKAKKVEMKIKQKRRKDPLFKYWERIDTYLKRKGIEKRVINANSIKYIGLTSDKLRKLEDANYISPIQAPSVVKTFYVKTLKELEKEGIL